MHTTSHPFCDYLRIRRFKLGSEPVDSTTTTNVSALMLRERKIGKGSNCMKNLCQ